MEKWLMKPPHILASSCVGCCIWLFFLLLELSESMRFAFVSMCVEKDFGTMGHDENLTLLLIGLLHRVVVLDELASQLVLRSSAPKFPDSVAHDRTAAFVIIRLAREWL